MVNVRCKMMLKEALKKMELHFVVIDLWEFKIMENLTNE